jgi:hypothetical protein
MFNNTEKFTTASEETRKKIHSDKLTPQHTQKSLQNNDPHPTKVLL